MTFIRSSSAECTRSLAAQPYGLVKRERVSSTFAGVKRLTKHIAPALLSSSPQH